MKFIDYNSLKEFYTIPEVCELFEMAKERSEGKVLSIRCLPHPERDRRSRFREI